MKKLRREGDPKTIPPMNANMDQKETELFQERIEAVLPASLILDFDATDTLAHGQQEGRFSHGYYDCHCFLPLYVFCSDRLLAACLLVSRSNSAQIARDLRDCRVE